MKIHKLFIVVGLVVFAGFLIGWVAYRESCHAVSQNPQTMAFDTRIAALRKYVLQVGAKGDWPFPEQPCLLAVSTEGEVLRLPEDFQTLVRRERISISSPEAALELATSYVGVSSPFKVLVISNPGMIPGTDRNPVPSNIAALISAPVLSRSANGFVIQLFTWKQLGGRLEKWTITILDNGTVKPQAEELRSWVGAAVGFG